MGDVIPALMGQAGGSQQVLGQFGLHRENLCQNQTEGCGQAFTSRAPFSHVVVSSLSSQHEPLPGLPVSMGEPPGCP